MSGTVCKIGIAPSQIGLRGGEKGDPGVDCPVKREETTPSDWVSVTSAVSSTTESHNNGLKTWGHYTSLDLVDARGVLGPAAKALLQRAHHILSLPRWLLCTIGRCLMRGLGRFLFGNECQHLRADLGANGRFCNASNKPSDLF